MNSYLEKNTALPLLNESWQNDRCLISEFDEISPLEAPIFRCIQSVRDRDLLIEIIHKIRPDIHTPYFKRLMKWIDALTNHFHEYVFSIEETLYVLIEFCLFDPHPIMVTQTEYEFQVSVAFYHKIIQLHGSLFLTKREYAKYFLTISLLYGKYPGFVIAPLYNNMFKNEMYIGNNELISWAKKLFGKYSIPHFFYEHLPYLSELEYQCMFYLLQGGSIRKFKELPISLSKKEAHYFNTVPYIESKENCLLNALVLSKFIAIDNSPKCDRDSSLNYPYYEVFWSGSVKESQELRAESFLRKVLQKYRDSLKSFVLDLDFWLIAFNKRAAVIKLAKRVAQREQLEIYLGDTEYIDFLISERIFNEDFNIKKTGPRQLARGVFNFHCPRAFSYYNNVYEEWGESEPPILFKRSGIEYQMVEITSSARLYYEGNTLHHCVMSYLDSCVKGHISIWALEYKMYDDFIPNLTVEVYKEAIVQAHGKFNRPASQEEYEILKVWGASKNLELKI